MEAVLCYNRGCGKTFIPDDDGQDQQLDEGEGPCQYHPGAPFFHDAYKGWTCCNRKATDFTEFLNFPGCTRGQHSRIKPVEPESVTGNGREETGTADPPSRLSSLPTLKRPPFEMPVRKVRATVTGGLRKELEANPLGDKQEEELQGEVKMGEACKNSGCTVGYAGDMNDSRLCRYHSGVPIFHEGMKYWSCCQRKTSDFQSFLNQEGCQEGKHCWIKPVDGFEQNISCRYDWHQTGNNMTVAIYAKKYDPDSSYVEVNPIRMIVHIVFPELGGHFDLDLELRGIISEEKTTVCMTATKIEIQLWKAEPGSWSSLNLPSKDGDTALSSLVDNKAQDSAGSPVNDESLKVNALDLDDLELGSGGRFVLSPEASARY